MRFWFSFVLILLQAMAFGQRIVVDEQLDDAFVGEELLYWMDESGNASFESLKNQEFVQGAKSVLNLGTISGVVWIELRIDNTTGKDIMMVLENPLYDEIEVYSPDTTGAYTVEKGGIGNLGMTRSYSNNYWMFELGHSDRRGLISYFVKLKSRRDMVLPLRITTKKPIIIGNHANDLLFGAFFGAMIFVLLFNLGAYIVFKESVYAFYLVHLLFQLLISSITQGHLFEFLGEKGAEFFYMLPTIAGLTNITIITFTQSFLNLKKNLPWMNTVLKVFLGIYLISISINLFTDWYYWGNLISKLTSLSLTVVILVGAVLSIQNKLRGAWFFLLGMGGFMLLLSLYILGTMGIVPISRFISQSTLLGVTVESLFLSLAIIAKFVGLREEHMVEKQLRLQLIEDQNTELERKVDERTRELYEKSIEVEAQNEELKQQQEELVTINHTLEEQRNYIERQVYATLTEKEKLEILVRERTVQLEELVNDLIKQNHDLEQFSYIISHNVRAPISRIQGLLNIFNRSKPEDPFNMQLLRYMEQSCNQIDEVIANLTEIISVRNKVNSNIEAVKLLEICEKVTQGLEDDILRTGATISIDFKIASMQSVKAYVQSIMHNLVSNSLKYRSPERPPEITIKTYAEGTQYVLEVSDNGIGVDLSNGGEAKVFGLYQRMHTHVEGKGVGMYLVKAQVESLNGKVKIMSQLDQGTRVLVYIPQNENEQI
ncbi:7TM diverse intracellular signaling domain-containing protein [Cytophagales bacterium LB-30]|uniref:histidine kinase n=1 Tax=Shiella aurantiaca TaxID=3058365 RepID=A0ABT8F7B5_9BACT|nr:7TM diverse intracellular signaling domain-containing protein [Shiella aurantiaca]MDN4166134.1 7TM diverse intracellular signaling domain-containing protein [Shiella aurantiaca]